MASGGGATELYVMHTVVDRPSICMGLFLSKLCSMRNASCKCRLEDEE